MSFPQTIEHVPAPFNRELFSLLPEGIYDSNDNDVFTHNDADR